MDPIPTEYLSICTQITNWIEYIHENKYQNRIWFHLANMAYTCLRQGKNKRKDCIHKQLGLSQYDLVDKLFGIVMDQTYAVANGELSHLMFATNPMGKKLCNDCILLFLWKTNCCETIIDRHYKIYCQSNSYVQSNACIIYFSQLMLSYPLVIKCVLSRTSNIDKLFGILIFYLKEMKLNSLISQPIFCNIQKQYAIMNQEIVAIFTFEYNLACILSMFQSLIPYFNKANLSMLSKLKFTEIYTAFIRKYCGLKHIKVNVNAFYQRFCKHSNAKIFKKTERFQPSHERIKDGELHTYVTTSVLSIGDITDMVTHRNAMLNKLVSVYCYYLQKMKKFKDDKEFKDSYDRLYLFGGESFSGYKSDMSSPYESKIQFCFGFGRVNNYQLHSIKHVKHHYKKWKQCSNDKCKTARNKLSFKICRGCKLVLYCSKHCQKRDWIAGHRTFCKLIVY